MTLRHIKIFLAVCENDCNITRAARALYMAQPAVSQAIADLEHYYGVQLFERLSRRLCITEAGLRFKAYAVHIRALFDEMEAGMHNWDDQGVLRVGASITIGSQFLPAYAKAFGVVYPAVELRAEVAQSKHLEGLLLENQLDLALIEGTVHSPLLVEEAYMEDELVGVCSAEGPFALGEVVAQEVFAAQRFLLREQGSGTREVLDSVMEAAGYTVHPAWQSISTGALVNAVIQGVGVAVLPRRMLALPLSLGRLHAFQVEGLPFRRKYHIIYHRDKFLTPAMQAFMELCRNYELDYPLPSL